MAEDLVDLARAEAARRWPSPNSGLYEGLTSGFALGVDWAEGFIWDHVGSILQTPSDELTGPEYRRAIIDLLVAGRSVSAPERKVGA